MPTLQLLTWDGVQVLLCPLLERIRPLKHNIALRGDADGKCRPSAWPTQSVHSAACNVRHRRAWRGWAQGAQTKQRHRALCRLNHQTQGLPCAHRSNCSQIRRQRVHNHSRNLVHPLIRLAAAVKERRRQGEPERPDIEVEDAQRQSMQQAGEWPGTDPTHSHPADTR